MPEEKIDFKKFVDELSFEDFYELLEYMEIRMKR